MSCIPEYGIVLTLASRAGKDVINRLLDKREKTRLGSRSGASEVKQHKWFGKINWGLLRNTRPPVSYCASLKVANCEGYTYIDRAVTVERIGCGKFPAS